MKTKIIMKCGLLLLASLILVSCAKENSANSTKESKKNKQSLESLNKGVNTEKINTESNNMQQSDTSTDDRAYTQDTNEKATIDYNTVKIEEKSDDGKVIEWVNYPEFKCNNKMYTKLNATLTDINNSNKEKAQKWLEDYKKEAQDSYNQGDSIDMYTRSQDVSATVETQNEKVLSIFLLRTEEVGGAHPNNYYEAININPTTGEQMELSDIVAMSEATNQTIARDIMKQYPEENFDQNELEDNIKLAFEQKTVVWNLIDNKLCLNYAEGLLGTDHALGGLSITIDLDEL